MNFLVDTNILIPLEPTKPDDLSDKTTEAVDFVHLLRQAGFQLIIHPIQKQDFQKDHDASRREMRNILLGKYIELRNPPTTSLVFQEEIQNIKPNSNDWVDFQLLVALERDAVDFLVTEDKGLRKLARRHDLADRVFDLSEAISRIKDLIGEPVPAPPAVRSVIAYELDESDPIFESFRDDYSPDFERWLTDCKRENRQAWIIEGDNEYAAVSIVNPETKNHLDLEGKILKICTFKTSEKFSGRKYGELLLKTIFSYALSKKYDGLYVTVLPKLDSLIAFFEDFGFHRIPDKTKRGEFKLTKPILSFATESSHEDELEPLDYHVRYGPTAIRIDNSQVFITPIKPEFHRLLFPEEENQKELVTGFFPFGNSIRKAYLCNSSLKRIDKGDLLLFYRSGDIRGITSVGIVENILVTSSPDILTKFVLKRTVYSKKEIEEMCLKPVLAIQFRYSGLMRPPIKFDELKYEGLISGPPQSIQSISKEKIEWLREQMKIRLQF